MSRWVAPSADRPRGITILGSTGSVGQSTVDLIEWDPQCLGSVAPGAGLAVVHDDHLEVEDDEVGLVADQLGPPDERAAHAGESCFLLQLADDRLGRCLPSLDAPARNRPAPSSRTVTAADEQQRVVLHGDAGR